MSSPQWMKKKPSGFQPYGKQTIDSPFFHLFLEPLLPVLRPILQLVFSVRWQLSRPLQIRALPSWVPIVDYPVIRDLPFLTVGQIILTLPLVIFFLSGYYFTFVSPDVETSGEFASFAMFATFLTANKSNSVFAFLFGIPFERLLPLHNFSSLIAVVLSFFHAYVAFAYGDGGDGGEGGGGDNSGSEDRRMLGSSDSQFGLNGPDPNLMKFLFDGSNNMSGTILTFSMLILVLSSLFPVFRRKFFDMWFWIHIALAILTVIFSFIHEVELMIFIAVWWGVDVVFRYLLLAGCRYPTTAKLNLVTDDIVEISFKKPKSFQYNPGQFVQIAVSDLGIYAFHPISISSAPHQSTVTLHVRVLGDWSNRLAELSKTKDEVRVLIEGPYGSLSVDVSDDSRYQMALCVSGGIGVTHCQSVAKSLIHEHKHGRRLKHLRFVWAIRDLSMLGVMSPLRNPRAVSPDVESSGGDKTVEFQSDMMEPSGQQQSTPTDADHRVTQQDIFLTKASPSTPVDMDDGRTLYFGRPDLGAIVEDVREEATRLGVTHVAVFVCGPKKLVDSLKSICRQESQQLLELHGVTFDIHEEIFDF